MKDVKDTPKLTFGQKLKKIWNYFTTYEKIWFISILVIAIVFSFLFPETDDPDYTLHVDNSSYAAVTDETFDTLDFTGTSGEFVVESVIVDGQEYETSSFTKYAEFTVDGADETTLRLALPDGVRLGKESSISIVCYEESDGGIFRVAAVNAEGVKLFSTDVSLTEGEGIGYRVEQNALNYLVSVKVITLLYLLDVILNVACELLISKQSKWNFIVSLAVEVVEILVCIFCMYRFATMAVTLLFWIPCDIVSFITWNKHRDSEKEEVTVVKKLTAMQDVLIIVGILIWTLGVGYLLTLIEVEGGIFANNVMFKNIVCYIDACASAVGIANGLLILFRYREQWIAWYICAILETVINIMAGQWILLVLKAGYLTNTTYGYILWTKYIKEHDIKIVSSKDKKRTVAA